MSKRPPRTHIKERDKRQSVIDEVCKLVEEGMTQKDSAVLAGISESTLYRWFDENDDNNFRSQVEASILKYKQNLIKVANFHSTKDGRIALEILARRFSEDFGNKATVEVINPQEIFKTMLNRLETGEVEEKKEEKKEDEQVSEDSEGDIQQS